MKQRCERRGEKGEREREKRGEERRGKPSEGENRKGTQKTRARARKETGEGSG